MDGKKQAAKAQIEYLETKDLIEELLRRSENSIILLQKTEHNKTILYPRWRGDHVKCIGLCEMLKDTILAYQPKEVEQR